jgi:hypothetical protein
MIDPKQCYPDNFLPPVSMSAASESFRPQCKRGAMRLRLVSGSADHDRFTILSGRRRV